MNIENIKRAKNHIVFLLGLIVGSFLIYYLNNLSIEIDKKYKEAKFTQFQLTAPTISTAHRELSKEEREWAEVAWRYFELNYQADTGFVNSVDKYPSTTMWDLGSYIYALISADRLSIIKKDEFDRRAKRLLSSLQKITLFDGILPNKVYNTISLKMSNYKDIIKSRGIGYSALDIGRLLSALQILKKRYPYLAKDIDAAIKRWDLSYLEKDNRVQGCIAKDNKKIFYQEGRLGYLQYASKSILLSGVGVFNSIQYTPYLSFKNIYGINIPYDIRDRRDSDANNYVLSEPYILDGLEYGWDYYSREFAYRIYKVQEERYKNTGILTAVSEGNIDKKPYFIYNTIFVNGKEWVAISEDGKEYNNLKTLSTKASFGFYALFNTEYSKELIAKIKALKSDRGWYAGIYEKSGKINRAITCNTNALILESLAYITKGSINK